MVVTFKSRVIRIFHKYSLPRWLVLVIDMSVVYVVFLIAYLLRHNFEIVYDVPLSFRQAFFVLGIYTFFIIIFKSYSGMIRHTTLKDTYKIIFSNLSALSVLLVITLLSRNYVWKPVFNNSMSILLIHFAVVTVSLFFFRIMVKMFYEFASATSHERKNVLIYGSGDLGIVVKRVIEGDTKSQYQIKGFIDDDKKIQGKKVDGYPVYSRRVLTKDFIEKGDITTFIIAINKIVPSKKKEVIESVIQLGCEILETPSVDTWLNGHLEVNNIKKVKFEDLLGRDAISLDLVKIQKGLQGKTILVTGAAGSIGSEISRQLTRFNTKQLVLVDQAETPSFYLEEELKNKNNGCNFKIIIGDVTREDVMEHIFEKYRPEIVFHAAAYKHVPIMEAHPHEAFRVNVGGTKNIADLSIKYGAEKFVMISSDKAVNPTNVMGATKKICELLVQAYSKRKGVITQFITTRFGNVLGSNGSVIPLFNKQIQEGGPVTITHPDVTRFFMTIPEACQLVLEAGFIGNGGQIYVFDMGEPVKVLDVAMNLIRLSGLEPNKDIMIKYTGLRPGEKLYEELFSGGEHQLPTHHPKISIAQVEENNFDIILVKIDKILKSLYKIQESKLIEEMTEIVPGYRRMYEIVNQ
ncbi:MAG: nucleoside-diphosphate sugar epimerase/dehydratase [Bacteroidia bacterium]|nr:nucleoside-diphosphate sugar epimerase/dehydratase [Bacteroidia bacterium]